mgnify:CR=1 FL=1
MPLLVDQPDWCHRREVHLERHWPTSSSSSSSLWVLGRHVQQQPPPSSSYSWLTDWLTEISDHNHHHHHSGQSALVQQPMSLSEHRAHQSSAFWVAHRMLSGRVPREKRRLRKEVKCITAAQQYLSNIHAQKCISSSLCCFYWSQMRRALMRSADSMIPLVRQTIIPLLIDRQTAHWPAAAAED